MTPLLNRLLWFTMILFLLSCSKSKRVDVLLKDQEIRDEIFSKITSDSIMTDEMLNYINDNERILQKIKSDKKMMKNLMSRDEMMDLMKNDSAITNMLMCNVMEIAGKDTNLCRRMDTQMKKNFLFDNPNLNFFPNLQLIAKDKLFVHKNKVYGK